MHKDNFRTYDVFHHRETGYTFINVLTHKDPDQMMESYIYLYIVNMKGELEDTKKFTIKLEEGLQNLEMFFLYDMAY
jgi:hypothetical protein